MKQQIMNYIRAGYSGIYIVSNEETRIEGEIKAVAQELNHKLFAWSIRHQASSSPVSIFRHS